MHVERHQLMDILRSRGDEKAAQRAEQSLPRIVDLARDSALLRLCGIDPSVLAVLLPAEDRLPQPVVPQLSQVSDSQGNPEAAFDAPGQDEALPRTASQPVNRCPRCESTFSSTDRMLDHLNVHLTNPPVKHRSIAPQLSGLSMSTLQLDAALEDLERTLREPDRPLGEPDRLPHEPQRPRRRRLLVMAAVGSLLLACGAVLIIAGSAAIGIAVVAVVFTLVAGERTRRRRGSRANRPKR